METDCIHFNDTGYFSKIISDYLDGHQRLEAFYQYKPHLDHFQEVIDNKQITLEHRSILATSLMNQYTTDKVSLKTFKKVEENISSLQHLDTYTVTTGHQLCLFTGPLYFIYKIVSAIKLADTLKTKFPDKKFVPVYWMATEDHDFAEINHFNYQEDKVEWNTDQSGAVGRMKLDGLNEVYETFDKLLTPYSTNVEELKKMFQDAYLKHDTLAAATRYLVNELFGEYGVVIVDGDDVELKRIFAPIVRKELTTEFSSEEVNKQSEDLIKHYKIQVNPREINLFYLSEGERNRIVREGNDYLINDTDKRFSKPEILEELENHPERFSPNVLLRPIYEETILPNLAYIGGGGELAYWFQLKTTFESVSLPMPMLILRNSVAWMNTKQSKAFKKVGITLKDLFKEEGVLIKEWTVKNASEDLSLSALKLENKETFEKLTKQARLVDESLVDHVRALETKQLKVLDSLSEKFIRAERKTQKESIDRIKYLKASLFRNRGLQERSSNFSELYIHHGNGMIDKLLNEFEVPTNQFIVFH